MGRLQHGACRGLVCGRSHTGRPCVCHHHARGTHDLGRTHAGTKIALVGNVVQQQYERVSLARGFYYVLQRRIREGLHLQHDALVCAVRGASVQPIACDVLHGHARTFQARNQVVQRSVALPQRRCHKGAPYGHMRIQSLGTCTTTLYETLGTTLMRTLALRRTLLLSSAAIPRVALPAAFATACARWRLCTRALSRAAAYVSAGLA